AQHHVAVKKTRAPVDREPIAYRHADGVGDERRHAAGALRDQLTIGAGEAHREIVVLVDVRAECRALDIGVDLIGNADEAMPDHFQSDRIDSDRGSLRAGYILHCPSVSLPLPDAERTWTSDSIKPHTSRLVIPGRLHSTSKDVLCRRTRNPCRS